MSRTGGKSSKIGNSRKWARVRWVRLMKIVFLDYCLCCMHLTARQKHETPIRLQYLLFKMEFLFPAEEEEPMIRGFSDDEPLVVA